MTQNNALKTAPSDAEADLLTQLLETAYDANKAFHEAVNDNEFKVWKDDLAATLADKEYSYLASFLKEQRSQNPDNAQKILEALILLRVKAGDAKRDNSSFLSYRHSLRVANNVLRIAEGVITDPDHLTALVVKALLHDLVEDFDPHNGAKFVQKFFGESVANGVRGMTMPSREKLCELYPEIVAQFVPPEELDNMSPEKYLTNLKDDFYGHHLLLKSELKLRFKKDRARLFADNMQFDELFIKAVDNPDSLTSDVNDVNDGSMVIYANDNLNARRPKEGNVVFLSSARAQKKLTERIDYHEAVMTEMERVAEKAGDPAYAQKIKIIQARLNDEFYATADQFENVVPLTAENRKKFSPISRLMASYVRRNDGPLLACG